MIVPNEPRRIAAVVQIAARVVIVGENLALLGQIEELLAGVAVKSPRAEIPRRRAWVDWLHQT